MLKNIFKKTTVLLIIFLIAFEGAFGNVQIFGSSIPRIIEGVIFIFIFKDFIKDSYNNKILLYTEKLFLIFTMLLFLKMFTITFFQYETEFSIFIDIFRIISIIIYIYLAYYIIKQDFKNLNLILFINSFIIVDAFFQSSVTPFTDIAWNIKNVYFPKNTEGYVDNLIFRARVTGIYTTSIPLAYVLTTNMIITSYLFLKTRFNIYIVYFIFLGIVAVFSLTRSVLISWVILFIYLSYLIIFKLTVVKKIIYIIFTVTVLLYSVNIYIHNEDKLSRVSSVSGSSAEGRLPLAITGIYTVVKHPFGVSKNTYLEAKKEMYDIFHVENILHYTSHNGLINVAFKYTLIGLFVYIIYMYLIIRLLNKTIPVYMRRFFFVALLSYFSNALLHNAFIVVDDFYALILIAIVAYEYSLFQNKGNNIDEKN